MGNEFVRGFAEEFIGALGDFARFMKQTDFEDDACEGCDYTPCLCDVPQSERWEGR